MSITITEFLTARYDEDQERAGSGWGSLREERWENTNEGQSILTPRGVLADIAAKRAILRLHQNAGYGYDASPPYGETGSCSECTDRDYVGLVDGDWPCDTLRALALPYAEHRDYHEEWRR